MAGPLTVALEASPLYPGAPQSFTNGEIHDWYRIVLGYSDKAVTYLLDEMQIQAGADVLDPFCGTGTTLVECKKRSIRSVGVDANPSSCFASRTKLNWHLCPVALAMELEAVRCAYVELLARRARYRNDRTYIYLSEAGLLDRGWISPKPLRKCLALKQAISGVRDESLRSAFRLALIAEVVHNASNVKFGPELYCGKPKVDVDVWTSFADRISVICSDLRKANPLKLISAEVFQGDARTLGCLPEQNRSFDAIICSPPYPTEHDYTRNSRLELAFLEEVTGIDSLRAIKRGMIRSHTKNIYRGDDDMSFMAGLSRVEEVAQKIEAKVQGKTSGFHRFYPRVIREYFGGMSRHFAAALPLLKPGAQAAYIVGDQASYCRVHVPTAELLEDVALVVGFEFARDQEMALSMVHPNLLDGGRKRPSAEEARGLMAEERLDAPQDIKVHNRVIGHLSRGLYRSPASALREIVSNAWDANATVVTIDTSPPSFRQVTIADNGDGFSAEDFMGHMSGNIGNSAKRQLSPSGLNGRPVIGRLGIGLLGIGQICESFIIASKRADGETWQARVTFNDDLKDQLDRTERPKSKDEDFKIGTFQMMLEPTLKIEGQGTILVADRLHVAFTTSFRDSISGERAVKLPRRWVECIEQFASKDSLQQVGEYGRLLWELGATCPVPYLNDAAVPNGLIVEDQKRLVSFGFKVTVDNRQLFKPILLEGNEYGYVPVDLGEQSFRLYGKELKFHGYLVAQNGKHLRPDELQGVLIRIKNIGIGYYDQTFLDYRTNEGPRSRWVTGEIYVETGLEDSLNIDRDSFNKFDPAYRELQGFLHGILKGNVFSEVNKRQDSRMEGRRAKKSADRATLTKDVVKKATAGRVALASDASTSVRPPGSQAQPEDSQSDASVVVTQLAPAELKTKKSHQTMAAAILTLYDVAHTDPDVQDPRAKFQDMLLDLLRKW